METVWLTQCIDIKKFRFTGEFHSFCFSLLIELQSKYQSDAIRVLSKYAKRGDLNRIGMFAGDPISKSYYDEIIKIINSQKMEHLKSPRIDINHDKCETPTTSDTCEAWKFKDINENRYDWKIFYVFLYFEQ